MRPAPWPSPAPTSLPALTRPTGSTPRCAPDWPPPGWPRSLSRRHTAGVRSRRLLAVTVVREVLAGVSAHLDSLFAMQGIGSFPVSTAAAEPLRQEWLPRVARLEAIGALGLTEPDVGSDLRAITTTVRQEGDELVVDGHKSFITNAGMRLLQHPRARRGRLFAGFRPSGHPWPQRHAPPPDHRPARPRRRHPRGRSGAGRQPPGRTRGRFQAHARDAGDLPGLGRGRRCRGGPGRPRQPSARIRTRQFGIRSAPRPLPRCSASWSRRVGRCTHTGRLRLPRASVVGPHLSSIAKVPRRKLRPASPTLGAGDGAVRVGARQRHRAALPEARRCDL